MPNLDFTKPIQTRDGRVVHDVHEIEHGLPECRHAKSLLGGYVDGQIHLWYPWGSWHHEHEHPLDLINVPEAES